MVFPGGSVVKNSLANAERRGFNFWIGKILWRMKWQPTPVFLCGKYHGQRSLVDYSSWSLKRVEQDIATKQQQHYIILHFIFPCALVTMSFIFSESVSNLVCSDSETDQNSISYGAPNLS